MMLNPEILDQFLTVMRKHNVMSANLESGGERIAVTMGPDFPVAPVGVDPAPGGWKVEVSDSQDPDPLGLGPLDAPMAFDDAEVTP